MQYPSFKSFRVAHLSCTCGDYQTVLLARSYEINLAKCRCSVPVEDVYNHPVYGSEVRSHHFSTSA